MSGTELILPATGNIIVGIVINAFYARTAWIYLVGIESEQSIFLMVEFHNKRWIDVWRAQRFVFIVLLVRLLPIANDTYLTRSISSRR